MASNAAMEQPGAAICTKTCSDGGLLCDSCGAAGHSGSSCPDMWTLPFLAIKNTFIEVLPPLNGSSLGFRVMRRQISDPVCTAGTSFEPFRPFTPPSLVPSSGDSGSEQKPADAPPRGEGGLSCSTSAASDEATPYDDDLVLLVPESAMAHKDEKASEEDLFAVPRDEFGMPTSLGSALHSQRQCKPCAFVKTEGGCNAGIRCRFCHFHHTTRVRVRPCKGKRERLRRILDRFERELDVYVTTGGTCNGVMDCLTELELPMMLQENETLKKTVFSRLLIYVEQTYGWHVGQARI